MVLRRIEQHPILTPAHRDDVEITWQGRPLSAKAGETIAAALFAHGIHIFGHHPQDGAPQGLFCANGQCTQCLVLADGKPVKACMTIVKPGMHVAPVDGLPALPEAVITPETHPINTIETEVLILGGGPAGMSAAIELGQLGVPTLLVDDKARLGGKLLLQTHRFFGSAEAVHAGTRGIEIASKLSAELAQLSSVTSWCSTTALAVFSDGQVGILRQPSTTQAANDALSAQEPAPGVTADTYTLVRPRVLIVATGARERALAFPGNTLPGVYGAGAFQTLVNRDLVRAADRLFIVGGGNVGLIAGYHAIQAGIEVVGLAEAASQVGGYKVHLDKLARLGVPIYLGHTVVSANGGDHVESITIAKAAEDFSSLPGTEQTFICDTVLIAVGLDPVNTFTQKARAYGMTVFDAGDAQAIAEASAAMFTGKIAGRQAAQALGHAIQVPEAWHRTAAILKSHPGATIRRELPARDTGVFPVFHCAQEIPCNPCTAVCPQHLIEIPGDDIRGLPVFTGLAGGKDCIGCERCLTICPGLAIILVDYRQDPQWPTVSVAYELATTYLTVGQIVEALDTEGESLGQATITRVKQPRGGDHTAVVQLRAPASIAKAIAGMRVPVLGHQGPLPHPVLPLADDTIVCRCERVTAGEIRALIREGCRDINELKAITRAGMGACGGKTCTPLILRLYQEAGIPLEDVTLGTDRPLFVETPLGAFAGERKANDDNA
ncbi:MAG: FAD-dependent oxidoreductase [Anaerolineae bacterium]|nr:FAD-dependent oxidoreductase [Anaerolineae bacterium]